MYHDKENALRRKRLRKIELYRPRLRVVRNADGRCNLSGILTPADLTQPMPILVVKQELTPHVARRLVLGAGLIEPEQGLEWGLVDELQPDDRLLDRALEVATGLASLPRDTYGVVKRQLRGEALDKIGRILGGEEEDPLAARWVGAEGADAAAAILDG